MKTSKPAKKKTEPKKNSGRRQPSSEGENPLQSLRALERHLAGIARSGRRSSTALDQAQELIYEAWEAPTVNGTAALAMEALSISMDCADAYNILAELIPETEEEAIRIYEMAVEAGERALGKKAFKQNVGYFWGLIETRPYMRARAGLAQTLWVAGAKEEAAGHYRELLRLNPNDNQGIRYLVLPCLIELNLDEEAESLMKQFEGDCMAIWLYSRALLDFRKLG
ncbi:MAG: hypothetical protein AB1772_13305, partial [Candidatus Zixiibacteriota bacterium]